MIKKLSSKFKWSKMVSENLKFKSTLYGRKTKADYDGSASDELGYVSRNKMYAFKLVWSIRH